MVLADVTRPAQSRQPPRVDCPAGTLTGVADPSQGTEAFLGIPYALPPIGMRRFQPAQPMKGWSGTRDATTFGPASAQMFDAHEGRYEDFGSVGAPGVWVGNEDSLTLNIWRPDHIDAPLPVIVWIHGGSNCFESSRLPIYDGAHLAAGGVVFVSLNYRLGPFGFLDVAAIGGPAGAHSNGLTDQLAALDWIARNIASFGGDPGTMTLVGESAGSMDIGWLVASGRLPAGIQRLVMLSGVASVVGIGWDGTSSAHDEAEGRRRAADFLAELGYRDFAALQAAPTAEILERQAEYAARHSILFDIDTLFYPRTGALAPCDPYAAARDGKARGLDVIIGFTAYEMGLWLLWDEALDRRGVDWAAGVVPHVPPAARAALPDLYRAWFPDEDDGIRGMHLLGDAMFAMPSLCLADLLVAGGANVFVYRFDWQADPRRRALHAVDLPFLFGKQDHESGIPLAGPVRDDSDWEGRCSVSETLGGALLKFARDGDPSTDTLPWPRWTGERRPVLLIDVDSRVAEDPLCERRAWWAATMLPPMPRARG